MLIRVYLGGVATERWAKVEDGVTQVSVRAKAVTDCDWARSWRAVKWRGLRRDWSRVEMDVTT